MRKLILLIIILIPCLCGAGNLNDDMARFYNNVSLEENGSVGVTLQDQTTPILIAPLHHLEASTTLAVVTVIDAYSITITGTTSFVDDSFIIVSDPTANEIWYARQIGAPVGNVISFDRPMDYAFPVGAIVTSNTTNMNVDGSSTPIIYSLRQGTSGVDITADVVRLMFFMVTATAVDLSTFGDIAGGITHGITLRYINNTYHNIVTIKTNGELAGIAYDIEMYAATNPQQGQDGLNARLTFGGQSKMGVVVRIGPDSDLQCIINDDLTDLTRFVIIAEGSVAIVD